jgi:iron complex outermembrane receptor protein
MSPRQPPKHDERRRTRLLHPLTGLALVLALPAVSRAQTPSPTETELPTVTVTMPRGTSTSFEVPGSVDRVEGEEIRAGRLQSQLSEGLAVVPGLQLRNRYNFAQDLQLSIRGFGARSSFGVRGVRLYVDGIPATLPDGQGQTSNVDIASLDRIEILRGPFSALYGNSSGGVLQAFTARGEGPPRLSYSTARASYDTWRQGLELSGAEGQLDYRFGANRFDTGGWRDHSAATRDLVNGKLGIALNDQSRLTLILNRVDVKAQDPLGLTAEQFASDPRQAPLAGTYDTRKSVLQNQLGLLWEHRVDARRELRIMAYGGQRDTLQYLSIPPLVQLNPRHAGGVIDLERAYHGLDVRWRSVSEWSAGTVEWVAGMSYDDMRERRRGYENYQGPPGDPTLGIRGNLRRQERNEVTSLDPYAQVIIHMGESWSLEAGVRRSRVHFRSNDHYITASNGDDGGDVRYAQTLPVASLRWQPSSELALYASAGRGFETPTLNELSYRADNIGGLNLALRPAVNDTLELGAKFRRAGHLLTLALFETRTQDEIVVATSSGGRTTFQNAGRTRRQGIELAWQARMQAHWRSHLAVTVLDATYRDAFCSPTPCTSGNTVPSGNRIPSIARESVFASIGWMPDQGWRTSIELQALSRVFVDDRNTANAPGYAIASIQAGYTKQWDGWEASAFARIDNVFDRRYAGSVIVNQGNGQYFESAPERNWAVGFQGVLQF